MTGGTGSVAGPALEGTVQSGSTPLANAQVQIFAAGTAGNGSAPVPLLAAALATDTNGAFHVAAGAYTCPTAATPLLIVSSGGQLGTQPNNAAIVFATAPGACGGVAQGTSFVIDEVTTVATVYALRPFLAAGAQLGSTATNVAGLDLAAQTVGSLADLQQGTAPGPSLAANGTAPVAKLNTLATLLQTCASAPTATSTACTNLFAQTSTTAGMPSNTFDAMLTIANQPGANVAALYALVSNRQFFRPGLSDAPPDWTLAMAYTGGGMNGPSAVSVDSVGRVWVANYGSVASLFSNFSAPVLAQGVTGYGLQESYGGAVDANDRMWVSNEQNSDKTINNGLGSVTLLDSNGPALSGNSLYATGGLNFPIGIAFDRNGTAWVVDYGDSHLTLLDSNGQAQSGANGYTSDQLQFPVAVAVDSKGNGWVANQSASTVTRVSPDGATFTSFTVGSEPSAVAVDAADNVWTANYYDDSLGLVSSSGQVLSSGGLLGGGLAHPTGIAVDGAGTVWVANYRAPGVSAFAGAGAQNPGTPISPAAGYGSDLGMLECFAVAIDAAGNVWFTSFGDNRLIEFPGAAAPVKTPLLGGVRLP